MGKPAYTSSDPYVHRLWAYLLERFPPVAYTVLVALFSGSAFALLQQQTENTVSFSVAIRAALVVLLVFFHLRVMDEHKDGEADRAAYPERLLTRGVVTLPMLAKLGGFAVLLEALLAFSISGVAFGVWTCAFMFTVLMKIEFGFGTWLKDHLVCYAITHNPIVGLLAIFLWSSTGVAWIPEFTLYVAIVSFGSLAFEVGRKIRLPEEERVGVESYSSVLGRASADHLLIAIRWMTGLLMAGLASRVGTPSVAVIGLILSIVTHGLLWRHTLKAKAVEALATFMLLMDFVLIWSLAW